MFFSTTTTQLGIDLGSSSIKMAEVKLAKQGKRPELFNYGSINWQVQEDFNLRDLHPRQIANIIKKIYKESGFQSKKIAMAVGMDQAYVLALNMPYKSRQELEGELTYEVKRRLPVDIQTVEYKYEIVDRDVKAQEMTVLIVAVPKTAIEHYREISQLAGLELITLEVESFSVVRALVGELEGAYLLIDIGALKTNISIIKNGYMVESKVLRFGGNDFTKAIAQKKGVVHVQGEDIKKAQGFNQETQDALQSYLDQIIREANVVVESFQGQKLGYVNKCILIGESSKMFGLKEYFTQQLNSFTILETKLNDKIIFPSNLQPNIVEDLNTRLVIAIGLALRPED